LAEDNDMSNPWPNLHALLALLTDEHSEVAETAQAKLIELGSAVLPFLDSVLADCGDAVLKKRVQGVIERILIQEELRAWERFASQPDEALDLETGIFLLSKIRWPDMQMDRYRAMLDEMATQVRTKWKFEIFPSMRVFAVSRFLFIDQGFSNDWDGYANPDNYHLSRVMDRKLGVPITLSVLYLLVARRLKVSASAVDVFGRFMVRYQDHADRELYLDIPMGGVFLRRDQCIQLLVESGYPYQPDSFQPLKTRDILARILEGLIVIYEDRKEEEQSRTMMRCLNLLLASGDGEEGSHRGAL
jgi:regulator of sirC expression with transglutaminase-like and TPR domain